MRREAEVTIGSEGGRDAGKTFVVKEMSADRAERWATRALIAVANAGVKLPDEVLRQGMAGIAVAGLSSLAVGARLNYAEVEPLLDEMMGCVRIKEPRLVRDLTPDDIEEVATRVRLRQEVLSLHLGFSIRDALSASRNGAASTDSPSTPTSPPPSA